MSITTLTVGVLMAWVILGSFLKWILHSKLSSIDGFAGIRPEMQDNYSGTIIGSFGDNE